MTKNKKSNRGIHTLAGEGNNICHLKRKRNQVTQNHSASFTSSLLFFKTIPFIFGRGVGGVGGEEELKNGEGYLYY